MAQSLVVCTVDVHQLAAIVRNRIDNALILDSRSFLEYNASHVINAINVGCAKLMKRRLQQEKLSIEDFLAQNCHWDVERSIDIIVYDQNTKDAKCLPPDSFMAVFLQKLLPVYNSVNILKGGFLEFQAAYPHLCEDERTKFAPLTSLSQPCLPVTNHGPTRILPFLYLGSQHDALNKEILQHHNITYQLNVSTSCPKPDFIQDSHFLRIPVIDNYSEKLLPHFPKAFQFLDKVKESGGCVLVHCLAGISRSATVAIAYVMKTQKMTSDEAYRYVKAKRATISPNFNFLGQLLEFEKQLQREYLVDLKSESAAPAFNTSSHGQRANCKSVENVVVGVDQNYNVMRYTDTSDVKTLKEHGSVQMCKKENLSFQRTSCTKRNNTPSFPEKQTSALNIKCLPISYLKDLNFTPCQTSFFSKPLSPSSEFSARNTSSENYSISPVKTENVSFPSPLSKPVDNKSNVFFTEVVLTECKMDISRSCSSIIPDLHSPPGLKVFDYDSKAYNRSDSVSTSGLGSEGSDFTDSWNDYTSSCERETDILMDDDYPSVPSEEDELQKSKMLGYIDCYDDSLTLYPKHGPLGSSEQEFSKCCSQSSKTKSAGICSPQFEHCPKYSAEETNGFESSSATVTERDAGGSSMLYRAQSCPGMLSSDAATSCATVLENITRNNNIKLRKSKHEKSSIDKCRNRYSCSSIDYMDYSQNIGSSRVSCPNSLSLSRGSENSTSSHCNYRHSMIQVS